MNELSIKVLSDYLHSIYTNANTIDKLKIVYRPYICPLVYLIKECNHSKSILDIGCGSGQFLLLLSQYTDVKKLGGIEISSSLVKNAKELLGNQCNASIQIETYDGNKIPDFVSEYEMITLIDVFHHLKKEMRNSFIVDIYKKMKVGDKFIFKDIDASHPFVLMNKIHDLILGGGVGSEISVIEAKQLLIRTGFRILSVSKKNMIWYPHYTILCIK